MNNTNINKNAITSKGSSYSNYIYTFRLPQSDDESNPQCLLSYQIETNQAFQEYLNDSETILERFKNALKFEENYITIMNMCVISLAQRMLEDIEDLALKAKNYSNGETHHIILLVEYYLLIHDDENAIKHLIELFIKKEQLDVVLALLKEVFSRKIYSIEHLSNFVQDNCLLVELIKINKQSFIQHHSYVSSNSFQTKKSLQLNQNFIKLLKQQSEQLAQSIQQKFSQQSNNTQSYQTQQTDQLSFISQTQNDNIDEMNFSLLDFSFIDIILDNPNLFSFQYRLPYMIGSHNTKEINKLQAKIAEGGFGEVFIAKHLKTNEIHALKIIKQQEDLNVNLILQEIIIQDKIQKLNPQLFLNLKPLIHLTKHSKLVDIFIPLELGQFSLYEYIQEHKIDKLEYNQFYNLFIDYIATLHSNKYAHRDIKPQNILYIKDVGWKLADFGESVRYDNVEDIYKIKGTIAFLPFKLRQQRKQIQQIKQNLLYNDLYAVVCTLIMIKNPQFNSQELTYYMDNTQLDQQLQQLLQNFDNIEILNSLKLPQLQQIETKVIIKKYILDQECQWDCYEKLRFYSQQKQQLDTQFIKQLDELLGFYKENQEQHKLVSLTLLISLSFPFQIEKFENIKLFNFQRHLLFRFKNYQNYLNSKLLVTIFGYYSTIKLYDLAIMMCDQHMSLEYDLNMHLLKISALIGLDQLQQAKEELELIYRYFISTQSYSLQEQISFFTLYKRVYNQVPLIKVDKIFKKGLINGQNQITYYHIEKDELNDPINMKILNEKSHLQLRLDDLFELVYKDPFKINQQICDETVKLFGIQFIEDGQLVNCQELIQLIKENLIFWTHKYISRIHIIAIGLNYVFNYYGKFQDSLNIGEYFHNILRNIGSCENILEHYQSYIHTQIIVYKLFNQQPTMFINWIYCLEETQYLSQYVMICLRLQIFTIQHIFIIRFDQTMLSQENIQVYKYLIVTHLEQLKSQIDQIGINNYQRQKLIRLVTFMIVRLLNSPQEYIPNILQIAKKLFLFLLEINQSQTTFIDVYNTTLFMTKQQKLNLNLLKQYMIDYHQLDDQKLYLDKFLAKILLDIYLSPIKVVNILNMYGLSIKQSLLVSWELKFNKDLRYFMQFPRWFGQAKTSKMQKVITSKIDQINLKFQYFRL